MIAAATAARRGLDVLIFEKAPNVGGTTGMSVGTIMAARSRQQIDAGIKDHPDLHAADLEAICQSMGVVDDAQLRRVLVDNVADTVEWLRGIGINFLAPLPQPPHSVDRLHQVMPTSRAYIVHLHRICVKLGVTFHLGMPVRRLVVEQSRVVGVEAGISDAAVLTRARVGVVLASGDAGGSGRLMHGYMKTWADDVEIYNPNNTGDGHEMALAVGADIVPRMDLGFESAAHIRFVRPKHNIFQDIPPYPWLTLMMVVAAKYLPKPMIRPILMRFLTTVLGPDSGVFKEGALLVNRHGARIGGEEDLPNMLIPKEPGGIAYLIFDHRFATKFSTWPYFISTAPGVAFAYFKDYKSTRPDLFASGRTLTDLANKRGFVAEQLQVSVELANRSRPDSMQLLEAPFYALGPVKTWVLVAPLGLRVTGHFEVLHRDGGIIPGLFAVGHVGMGGFTMTGHGHGLGWAFTSGRLAAEYAADQKARGADS
jgi:succinate dehydrogenase/fumarate reductase flavoprotein subunit